MKIDDLVGESQDEKKKGWIEIESWSWGATQQGTQAFGGGGGAGKVSMQDFHITKKIDKATQELFIHCATGKHFGTCKLVARKAGGKQEEYLKIDLTDVLVSSYQSGGHGSGGELPMEQISLNFSKVKWEYLTQDNKGATQTAGNFTYDLKQNKAT
jgi:type VI secretion system secreted protein Hcp